MLERVRDKEKEGLVLIQAISLHTAFGEYLVCPMALVSLGIVP